jgi:anti-sigma-K factor RskA
MNSHETWETLAAVYAVGALDGDDLGRFEAHLAGGCEPCTTALRESHEALARMALAITPAVPPPAVRAAVLARIGTPPRQAERQALRRGWLTWTAATAAVVALAVMFTGGVVASRYEKRLGQMAREMAATREALQKNEGALREQVAAYQGAVELLRDPATRVVDLRGQGVPATARVIWNDKAGGHLVVANLPPAPEGKAYELWALGEGAPKPAGLFQVAADGRAVQRVEPVGGSPKGFAISLEPAGGVPAPTGPIVLASR